jgi:hypothetical protein
VQTARRGIALLPSREVLIQDELKGLRPGSRVRWGMITTGEPDSLGKNDLMLRQAGKNLRLAIVSPKTADWRQIETAKPPNKWDSPNPDTRMVAFEATAPASGELTLIVAATPGSCVAAAASKLPVVRLRDWSRSR